MRTIMSIVLVSAMLFINCPSIFAESDGMNMRIDMIPWEKVNEYLPKNSKFTVLDVETGKKFNVQRRAGSQHADVQPLTSTDTKIMKEIYGGKWSWKRRAIIVIHHDQWIAASMHGMPHGAGKLKNNFPGHFCIHFYGSKTHRSNDMDLSHKLMTLKAAGELRAYVEKSDPYELISAFVSGIKQQNPWIMSLISLQDIDWKDNIYTIENIKLTRISTVAIEDLANKLSLEIPVEIEWINNQTGKEFFNGDIYLFRSSHTDAWKIDSLRFLEDSCIFKDHGVCKEKENRESDLRDG